MIPGQMFSQGKLSSKRTHTVFMDAWNRIVTCVMAVLELVVSYHSELIGCGEMAELAAPLH